MQFIRYYILLFSIICSNIIIHANERGVDYQNLVFEDITNEEGEAPPSVGNIIQDKQGFIWLGTANGLYRYDAYTFDLFQYNPEDTTSLSNNDVQCIMEDNEGRIWVGTIYGLSVLNKQTGDFERFFHDPEDHNSLWQNSINDIIQRKNGEIWITTSKGLNVYDVQHKQLARVDIDEAIEKIKKNHWEKDKNISFLTICEDHKENLWFGTYNHGIIKFNTEKKELKQFYIHQKKYINRVPVIVEDQNNMLHIGAFYNHHFLFDPVTEKIIDTINSSLRIRSVMIDDSGNIWTGGVNELIIYSGKDYSTLAYYKAEDDGKTILEKGSLIDVIFQDKNKNIWISTRRGIRVYFIYKNNFNKYFHEINNPKFRDYGKELFVDRQQNFWFGTFGDGLMLFDKTLQLQKRFFGNSSRMSFIWSITQDENDNIWVGTNNGIKVYDPFQKQFVRTIRNNESNNDILSHNLVYEILHDSKGNKWIATEEGLDLLTPDGETKHFSEKDGIINKKVNAMLEDEKGNIWIGTKYGLSCYNSENESVKNYVYDPQTGSGLSNQKVNAIHIDTTGVWIATDYGLNRLDPEENTIDYFFKQDGLIDNKITNLDIDMQGNLWMLSRVGVSRMNLKTKEIITFDKNDGLSINYSGMFINDSVLYLGGKNTGFYVFSINDIKINLIAPPVYITEIQANNEIVQKGYGKIQEQIITLQHHQSSIQLEFTALNYLFPEKNHYKYKLNGAEEQWNTTSGKRRIAVYNNLKPGKYTFLVEASNNNGIWNNKPETVQIKILQPWWNTGWAYIMYFLIFVGLIYILFRIRNFQKHQEKAKFQHEQDELKLTYFTNISHEFRTPLTLLYGMIEQLFKNTELPESIRKQLNILYNYALRMKNLVNQVLELRRLNIGKLKPEYNYADIIPFLKRTYFSFDPLAKQYDIQYDFICPYDTYECFYDEEKLETILMNLISNAFKHTPAKEKIIFEMEIQEQNNVDAESSEKTLIIKVTNTGKYIPENEIQKIFERFYQSEYSSSDKKEGTGIGLALSKELVEMLNGTIAVDSKPEAIITFTVLLPVPNLPAPVQLNDNKNKFIPATHIPYPDISEQSTDESGEKIQNGEQQVMLIAEDNKEVRAFIHSLFVKNYKIIEAENGKDGFEKTLKYMPDIIISDIMMPEYDGFNFCNDIKQNEQTNHIPLILLTAKTAEEYKLTGYQIGADDYVVKPFSSDLLIARVNNLLKNRARLKEIYRKRYLLDNNIVSNENENEGSGNVDKFLSRVKTLVKENMYNETYSVNQLADDLNISRIHLNRKLKTIMGISPSEFIKLCRLNEAMHILKTEPKLTISEVAYDVGFKDLSHFSKAFKAHYGKKPSDIERK